jgi:hypothetical protein
MENSLRAYQKAFCGGIYSIDIIHAANPVARITGVGAHNGPKIAQTKRRTQRLHPPSSTPCSRAVGFHLLPRRKKMEPDRANHTGSV